MCQKGDVARTGNCILDVALKKYTLCMTPESILGIQLKWTLK